jgi:hypothetical protein
MAGLQRPLTLCFIYCVLIACSIHELKAILTVSSLLAAAAAAAAATTTNIMASSSSEPPVHLQLDQGRYRGRLLPQSAHLPRAVESYLGIPYAQSTAGPNRFRPPQPLARSPAARAQPKEEEDDDSWIPRDEDGDVVHSAVAYGDICPQASGPGAKGPAQSENCLNANIFLPHDQRRATTVADSSSSGSSSNDHDDDASASAPLPPALLPVVVYVHGGAFNGGAGLERNMASFVAWADRPLVGVSFNYRVGALGFLPSGLTAREGLLNLGLRDQQLLFAWVAENARAFGGDPENVTIMGLSAGAHSVGLPFSLSFLLSCFLAFSFLPFFSI